MNKNPISYYTASNPAPYTPARVRRSGYEPSDTETDWQDSPPFVDWREDGVGIGKGAMMDFELSGKKSPLRHRRRNSWKPDDTSPKRDSELPYRARKEEGRTVSPLPRRRNISPLARRNTEKSPTREERISQVQFGEEIRANERLGHGHRTPSKSRPRTREKEQDDRQSQREQRRERTPSPLARNISDNLNEGEAFHARKLSIAELNEMVAKMNLNGNGNRFNVQSSFESTGDIFFSRDQAAIEKQKQNSSQIKSNGVNVVPRPEGLPRIKTVLYPNKSEGNLLPKPPSQRTYSYTDRRAVNTSRSGTSGYTGGKFSSEDSKMSDFSGIGSLKMFLSNRKKNQGDAWFSCVRRGSCRKTRSPKRQHFDESLYIERASVAERLDQFWADKYRPRTLDAFICHKKEAQLLRQFVTHNGIPHILLKGPSGSGKKAIAMALLGEIFGDACWNISHDLRQFQVQEKRAKQVTVPVTFSEHHMELNVNHDPNAKYALMGIVREISNNYAIAPEVSNIDMRPDYKVIVLYGVDKAPENIQHLIKWIMDCYTDACKLILCCEDDENILEPVRSRCKVLNIEAPITHEIIEVLMQVARKEDFDLPMSFAAKIATKSKHNLRKAIMALEACKAHNYPFMDDQPIPFGWEDILIDLTVEILNDPSPGRLYFVRGKFQKLLVDFVHPKLILLKLVEEFLKGVEANSRREIYYWHAYYDKRMPMGTSALLKLEEFAAKFMSIQRRAIGSRQIE